jgi:hypothetical protein
LDDSDDDYDNHSIQQLFFLITLKKYLISVIGQLFPLITLNYM